MFRSGNLLSIGALLVAASVAGCHRSSGASKEEYLSRGNGYAEKRQFAEAIVEYRNAVKQDPRFGEAHRQLAAAYLKTNDARNALLETIAAADLLPNDIEAQLNASRILVVAGKLEDARKRAENVLAKDPKNVQALLLQAGATAGLKDFDTAIKEINDAIELDANDARGYATLGSIQMNQGQRAEAEATFKKALAVQPPSSVAQLAYANFLWATGRLAESEAPLKRAIELDPKNVTALRALATYYMASGRVAEAEAPLISLTNALDTVGARLTLTDYYVAARRPANARPLLEELAKNPEAFDSATLRLALLDFTDKHMAEAHKKVDAVLAKHPKNTNALILNARLLVADGRTNEALASAVAAVASDPHSAAAQNALGTIQASRNDTDAAIAAFSEVVKLSPRSVAAKVQLADLQGRKGALDTARQLAEQAHQDAPRDRGARMTLARTLIAQGEVAKAEPLLNDLLRDYPNAAPLHALQGDAYLAQHNNAAARKEFDRALALDPKSMTALRGRVTLDFADKNLPQASALLERRLQLTPKDPEQLLLVSGLYASLGNSERQEQVLRNVIDVDPNNQSAYANLATLYAQRGKLDEAKANYEQANKVRPNSGALTMIALILEMQQKPADAQKVYEQAIALNPNAGVAANNLAWLSADRGGNLDIALQLAQTAKQQMPELPQVNDTLGWIYYKKNLNDQAIPLFMESIERDPKNPIFHYHLGLAYYNALEFDKAESAFNDALKLQPGFREAQEAKARLQAKN